MTAAASTRRSIAAAGLIVTGAYLASRVLGWIRLAVIGTTFGAGGDLDAFFAAFRIPDLIFQLVAAGALSSALIPVLAGLHATGEDERAWTVASTVTNLMLAALLVLAILLEILAPLVVPLITPGFDIVRTEQTVQLTRIMLISPILLALGAVASSILNARGRFAAASIAPLLYNLAIIGAAVFLVPSLGVVGLAIGVVVGSFLNLVVQLRSLGQTGFRYEPVLELHEPAAREALLLMAPRAVGLGVSQLTFIVATTLASGLAAGSITALNVAWTILQIPIGVIGVPLGVVVFPSLARELALGSVGQFRALLNRSLRLIVFAMVPLMALGIVLRREVVTLLFAYGRFDEAAIGLTSDTLTYFFLGLVAHSLIAILARAFYAGKDTRTPVVAAILAVVVNVSIGILTVGSLGLAGLALGIALGAWAEAIYLLAVIQRRLQHLDLGSLVRAVVETGAASLGAGVVTFLVLNGIGDLVGPTPARPALAGQTIVAGVAGLASFAAIAFALRIPELPAIVEVMVDLVRRRRRA